MNSSATIGIIGTGKLGRTLARLSLAAGLSVVIHGSGPLARTARVLESFDIAATPASLDEVTAADIVVLAIPLSDAEVLDGSLFDRTIVVDPMNHWDEADGPRPDFDDPSTPTSMLVQRWFDRARVVKAFNHVAYKDLAGGARVSGDPHRWGVAVAANDADAGTTVAAWVDAVGFDPVMVGSLAATYALQPGQPLFGATLSAAALETLLR